MIGDGCENVPRKRGEDAKTFGDVLELADRPDLGSGAQA